MGVTNLQPTLRGPTLELRPTVADDWEGLFTAAADPLIWALHPVHDRWQEPVFRAYFDAALASGGSLTIRDRASGAIIGSSRYELVRAAPGEVEIGSTFLIRACWGGGANREMKALMIGHALAHFDAVTFLVGEHNLRSRRAMEKIGGALTDRHFDAPLADGRIARHVIYRIDQPLPQAAV